MASENILFTQINLHRCKEACDLLMRRLTEQKVPIALVQEPSAYNNTITQPTSDHLRVFQGTRDARPRAGIVTHKDLNSCLIPQLSDRDQVAVYLNLGPKNRFPKIVVASVYLPYDSGADPPGQLFEKLVDYCSRRQLPLIIGSDANSQNTVWGSTKTNSRGAKLLEYLYSTNLKIANVGNEPTFVTRSRREVIDVTFCSPEVSRHIRKWRVAEEETLSDHRLGISVTGPGADT